MNDAKPSGDRSKYLIDGRRVRMSDLIEAGLIESGTELHFVRPRVAERHTAIVLADGRLKLDDGRAYGSPSRAAGVATGGSVDGWYAWRIKDTGELLADVRRRLLEEAGQDTYSSHVGERSTVERHEFLNRTREAAKNNTPTATTVRELIAHWNAKSRTQALIERVENDLDNHGLVTDPHFRKVGLDSRIVITEHAAEADDVTEPAQSQPAPARPSAIPSAAHVAEAPEQLDEVGITLGNIPSATAGVESVRKDATYTQAITTMLLNDYSQLAVMTGPDNLEGAVTWRSIAREMHSRSDSRLSDAVVRAPEYRYDTELIDILPILQTEDFVFVTDRDGCVSGIVTAADVVQAYGQMATPFFLVGELDQLLRRIIADTFDIESIRALCDTNGRRKITTHDKLTMGDYERILQNPANWDALDWPLDRDMFIQRLSELRKTRNDIMHFNPDPVPEAVISRLRTLIQILRRLA